MKQNFRVSNIAADPIKLSSEKVTKNEWVNFGDDNDYFDYLLDLYNGSAIHGAITLSKAEQVYGGGLDALNKQSNIIGYNTIKSLLKSKDLKNFILDYLIFGNATLQVIWSKDKSKIAKVDYIPVKNIRPQQCDEEGVINNYYYSDNWKQYRKEQYKPLPFPAFNIEQRGGIQILWIKNTNPSLFYFGLPDYIAGVNYIELDIAIGEYYLNYAVNGFSPTMFVQFNNGIPSEDEQIDVERRFLSKFSGEQGQKIMFGFNDSPEVATKIDTIQSSDGDKQYELLQETVANRIVTAHRIVSPTLFGFRDSGGLGNNANELYQAQELTYKLLIQSFQEEVIDEVVKPIANTNGVNLEWELVRRELVDNPNKTVEAPTNQPSNQATALSEVDRLTEKTAQELLDDLEGENVGDEWELVDSREYSSENGSIEEWAKDKIGDDVDLYNTELAFIKSSPSRSSQLDKSIYKVRYSYEEKYSSGQSRLFCSDMMTRTKSGVVYRLEDIDKASRAGINRQFGHKGEPYDLFRFKGGVNCGHFWQENLYKLKKKQDGSYYKDKALSSSKEVESIPKSYEPKPRGRQDAKTAPKDMPNNGHHPNYKK